MSEPMEARRPVELDVYRKVEIVRVEECKSCQNKALASRRRRGAWKSGGIATAKLIPWAAFGYQLNHFLLSHWDNPLLFIASMASMCAALFGGIFGAVWICEVADEGAALGEKVAPAQFPAQYTPQDGEDL